MAGVPTSSEPPPPDDAAGSVCARTSFAIFSRSGSAAEQEPDQTWVGLIPPFRHRGGRRLRRGTGPVPGYRRSRARVEPSHPALGPVRVLALGARLRPDDEGIVEAAAQAPGTPGAEGHAALAVPEEVGPVREAGLVPGQVGRERPESALHAAIGRPAAEDPQLAVVPPRGRAFERTEPRTGSATRQAPPPLRHQVIRDLSPGTDEVGGRQDQGGVVHRTLGRRCRQLPRLRRSIGAHDDAIPAGQLSAGPWRIRSSGPTRSAAVRSTGRRPGRHRGLAAAGRGPSGSTSPRSGTRGPAGRHGPVRRPAR